MTAVAIYRWTAGAAFFRRESSTNGIRERDHSFRWFSVPIWPPSREDARERTRHKRAALCLSTRARERERDSFTREIISATRGTPAAAAAAGKFLARMQHVEISRIISASLGGALRGTRVLARPVENDEGGEVTFSDDEVSDRGIRPAENRERRTTIGER